ncbi:hypothetical protein Tsubulata_035453 [Turnera subulata]|uniref:SGNH hydrolase-type esterase domain-containing protein n=1 Tax=Turnera subulata TaxID=218843 RepID=A0A9Q0F7F1_9ROSI|nr:hypothetical protein Tsubulata_035453 [Turnera subulata]
MCVVLRAEPLYHQRSRHLCFSFILPCPSPSLSPPPPVLSPSLSQPPSPSTAQLLPTTTSSHRPSSLHLSLVTVVVDPSPTLLCLLVAHKSPPLWVNRQASGRLCSSPEIAVDGLWPILSFSRLRRATHKWVALVATHAALLPELNWNSVLPNTTMPDQAVTDGLHLGGGVKLLVFGDSFADTGNLQAIKRPGNPFNYPLGMTWRGKPTGRQSDGYVLTDIIALFFNMTSAPPTYSLWEKKSVADSELKNGMNFAFGGSGALTTWESVTLSVQLGQFKQIVKSMVFTANDLKDSVAVLSSIGNDWAYYVANHGLMGLEDYMKKVRAAILEFLEELGKMGIKKVLTNLVITTNITALVDHNKLLKEEIDAFAKRDYINIVVLDYDKLLPAAMAMYGKEKGHPKEDCCDLLPEFINKFEVFCGDKDPSGNKAYTLCQDPAQYFHFSRGHLSHDGWKKDEYIISRVKYS